MNEIQLSSDIKQIELEINHHKNIAGQSIWEIGRRLNHVKENDLAHGEFMSWVNSIGMEYKEAQRFMKVANELPEWTTLSNLGSQTLYLIATLPEEERTKEHVTEKGETKTPDEMTVRELKELKKKIREQEQIIKQKEDVIDVLSDPALAPRPIIKEVMPPDYKAVKEDIAQLEDALKQSNKEVSNLKNRNNHVEMQYERMLEERETIIKQAREYEELQENIAKLKGKMTDTQKEIAAQKNVSDLIQETNKVINNLAPIAYIDDLQTLRNDPWVFEELSKTINRLERLSRDLNKIINQSEIIEGVIIDE